MWGDLDRSPWIEFEESKPEDQRMPKARHLEPRPRPEEALRLGKRSGTASSILDLSFILLTILSLSLNLNLRQEVLPVFSGLSGYRNHLRDFAQLPGRRQ